jgi:hypothetical protein
MDFGPDFRSHGVISIEPPALASPYPLLVPQAAPDGIDAGGIRLPEILEPLGIYTGWNLRARNSGSPGELAGLSGSFFPFSPAHIRSRYPGRDHYLACIDQAAALLEHRRFLLPADRARLRERAAIAWDLVTSGALR